MDKFCSLQYCSRFGSRRGSSTIEYVILMAVGLLFATILHSVIDGAEIRQILADKVMEIISGKEQKPPKKTPDNPQIPKQPSGFAPKPAQVKTASLKPVAATDLHKKHNIRYKDCGAKDCTKVISRYTHRPHGTLADHNVTDLQMAMFATFAYGDMDWMQYQDLKQYLKTGSWREDLELRIEEKNGFAAKTFVNKDDNTVLISYRGTDGFLRDAGDDLHLVFRDRIEQEESAEKYYKEVTAKYGDFRVIQTGHSLGGYLAQSVAAKYNVPTVTFNAPGKKHNSRPDLEFANRNGLLDDLIHNYVIRDDIPGNVNIHLGKTYLLNTPSEQRNIASRNDYAEAPGLLKNLRENSLKNHSIAHFSGIHGGKFSKKYAHFRKYYDQNGYIVPRNSIKEIRAP